MSIIKKHQKHVSTSSAPKPPSDLPFIRQGKLLDDGTIHIGYFPLRNRGAEPWLSEDELALIIQKLINWYDLTDPTTITNIRKVFFYYFPHQEDEEEPCFHVYLDLADNIEEELEKFDSSAVLFINEMRRIVHLELDIKKMMEGIGDVSPVWAERRTI